MTILFQNSSGVLFAYLCVHISVQIEQIMYVWVGRQIDKQIARQNLYLSSYLQFLLLCIYSCQFELLSCVISFQLELFFQYSLEGSSPGNKFFPCWYINEYLHVSSIKKQFHWTQNSASTVFSSTFKYTTLAYILSAQKSVVMFLFLSA